MQEHKGYKKNTKHVQSACYTTVQYLLVSIPLYAVLIYGAYYKQEQSLEKQNSFAYIL
jgi:uncharacterized membrane protein YukC